jgi:hypothetical protein
MQKFYAQKPEVSIGVAMGNEPRKQHSAADAATKDDSRKKADCGQR